jgi:hypothetical protein
MKKIFTLLTVLLASLAGFAQTNGKITGTVQDGNTKTLESATIRQR